MGRLFDKTVKIHRSAETVDALKTASSSWVLQSTTVCRLIRKNQNSIRQGRPRDMEYGLTFRIYLPPDTDIQAGDQVEIDGICYLVAEPYCPAGHHIEAEIMTNREV